MTENQNRWYKGTWEPRTDISPHQTDFATKLRVPFLATPYPSRDYRFGIIVGFDDWPLRGEIPTNEEVEVIASVRNAYTDYFFPEPNAFRTEMEGFAPYDIEGGHPCRYFIKRADGGWAFRVNTWSRGPEFVPWVTEPAMTLAEIIDLADLHYERLP